MIRPENSVRNFRAALVSFLVVGMVCAALPLGAAPSPGKTEVHDLQGVVAALLAQDSATSEADINGDGQIDVRDFQGLVGGACPGETPEEDKETAPQWVASALLGPSPTLRTTPPAHKTTSLIPSLACWITPMQAFVVPETSRDLPDLRGRTHCLLSPHAPPA